jgi:hypothetical protein
MHLSVSCLKLLVTIFVFDCFLTILRASYWVVIYSLSQTSCRAQPSFRGGGEEDKGEAQVERSPHGVRFRGAAFEDDE